MSSNFSIVEYLGETNESKCGYCKSPDGSNSHGFWAHKLNTTDYQALINRNWRRSGSYCYIPKNADTCCPMYTIKSDAINFKLSKNHKKVLKRMNKYLRDGIKDKERSHGSVRSNAEEPKPSKEHTDVDMKNISVTSIEGERSGLQVSSPKRDQQPKKKENVETPKNELLPDKSSEKPSNPKKAKLIRLERKKAKLAAKGLTLEDVQPKKVKCPQKSLEDFLLEEPVDGKHRLEVKLIPSKDGTSKDIFNLYKRYQMKIHNDSPEKLSIRSYERFLVNSPLQTKVVTASAAEESNVKYSFDLFHKYEIAIHENAGTEFSHFIQFLIQSPLKFKKDETTAPQGFGSFHYQYFLDGVLIAVGVIDILPDCVSSVYFYYDPAYSFLSLGTYASLREIALVRDINKKCPTLSSYYLGFYIPSCPKMRYKAHVKPSFLLCPEIFTFHLLDENLSKLVDEVRYRRINLDEEDEDKFTKDDLRNVLVLADRTAMRFGDFKRLASLPREMKENSDDVMEYGSLVGRTLSQRMLLFRL